MMFPESRKTKETNYFLERDKQKRFSIAAQVQREARNQAFFLHRKPIQSSVRQIPQRSQARRPTLRKSLDSLTGQLFLFEKRVLRPEALPLEEFIAVTLPRGKRCLLALSQEGALIISRKDCAVSLISSVPWDDFSLFDCIVDPLLGFYVLDVLVWQSNITFTLPAEKRLNLLQDVTQVSRVEAKVNLVPISLRPGDHYEDAGKGVLFYHRQGIYQMGLASTVFKWRNPAEIKRLRDYAVVKITAGEAITFEGKNLGWLDTRDSVLNNSLVKFSVRNGSGEFRGKAAGYCHADDYSRVVLHYCLNQQEACLPPEAANVLQPTSFDLDLETTAEQEKLTSFRRNLQFIHLTHQEPPCSVPGP